MKNRRISIILLSIIALASIVQMFFQAGISLDENLSYAETFAIVGKHQWIVLLSNIAILMIGLFPVSKKHVS